MDEIIKLLGIPQDILTLTKPLKKEKVFTTVKNNIPLLEGYNYMADLLMLPEDKKGNKYCLVIVDLGNDEFDIEPIKNKTPKIVLEAMKLIFKRKYLNEPLATLATDNGTEFMNVFDKWLKNNGIRHKIALAYRHSQQSTVESLNKQLGYLFNLYMNKKEKETGKIYKEWTDIVNIIREKLNEVRKKPNKSISKYDYPLLNVDAEPKFKVNDVVYYKSEIPLNALGKNQSTNIFRVGDYRFNVAPKKIKYILPYAGKVPFRYILEGLENVSYPESQLLLTNEKESKFIVKEIIDKKKEKGRIYYKVWFKNYKKVDATWEPRTELIKDGLKDYIDEYENKN